MAPRKPTIEPIESDQRVARESSILRTLEQGLGSIEAEIDAQKIEEHLERRTTTEDPLGRIPRNKLRLSSRNAQLQARLDKHRATTPAQKDPEPAGGKSPDSVLSALEIIKGSRPPSRVSRQKLIEQLEADRDVIRQAIFAQRPIVDAIRDELIAAQSLRDREAWRAIQLRKFRALQAVAALWDEENDFRKSRIDAGYTPWRSDLLPALAPRPMLVLGSERDWDSEISRMRIALEKEGIL